MKSQLTSDEISVSRITYRISNEISTSRITYRKSDKILESIIYLGYMKLNWKFRF